MMSFLALWPLTAMLFMSSTGELPWLWSHRAGSHQTSCKPSHGGAEILITSEDIYQLARYCPGRIMTWQAQPGKKMRQNEPLHKQKEASGTDLSVLVVLLWGSKLCWNVFCRLGELWSFSPVRVLWFTFMLHPFYLLGHFLYQNWLFPRNL